MKKHTLALSLLAGLFCTSAIAAIPSTIRIGTDTTYAPFSSKDAKGNFVGFDIDLGNEMCKRMQVKCVWVGSDFDSLIPSLKARKIDAVISSLSITEKRQQEIAFSGKLYAADSRLIAVKGADIQPTLASLKGKHVGVLQGSTQEAYANEKWRAEGVDVVAYQNQDLIYSDLSAGRLDAALQDEVAASEGFLKQPAGKDFAFAGPSVKDKKYFGDGTGVGLRKEDAELVSAFNNALDTLRKDGTYDKMAQKYFNFNVYGD
ncbi:lysine/arginine/ornithine ABC transporter substrate-binding protein ArgT [Shimwellia blattae]|uniref:Lysine-, arginine-, ornithine-binding periplasmic protein n=1 Tax=Shimwellia blattae (strain ATCC 29907 / DSM 4481 / JCM 1650 / NBRC 105725 / CDC 9005-74) TaxID=630626 RepID=I2B735_SHIBC|nr:lysine/arginine/ornithine ABC transporter substrate-binding protein ArgT [Shimwellia blattae]AFJ46339.1 lysine-, arginine-, ornithine-binding periplasmic protein [Shimwellia blattae DSM 4481 = NBRC 105725]GAB79922.1 histidine ABC transporter substrate-binding periplasmic protein [Shimwellia blattae DSM 4481 = NBRC 105725]VDY63805.1 Lysine-arginine-ornithine-binding periplasmic protein precursor [Shimwellia blattae]VEC21943.1 Lysine-arginine-ornithine-binding periplasmic protein precursor [Sh